MPATESRGRVCARHNEYAADGNCRWCEQTVVVRAAVLTDFCVCNAAVGPAVSDACACRRWYALTDLDRWTCNCGIAHTKAWCGRAVVVPWP